MSGELLNGAPHVIRHTLSISKLCMRSPRSVLPDWRHRPVQTGCARRSPDGRYECFLESCHSPPCACSWRQHPACCHKGPAAQLCRLDSTSSNFHVGAFDDSDLDGSATVSHPLLAHSVSAIWISQDPADRPEGRFRRNAS